MTPLSTIVLINDQAEDSDNCATAANSRSLIGVPYGLLLIRSIMFWRRSFVFLPTLIFWKRNVSGLMVNLLASTVFSPCTSLSGLSGFTAVGRLMPKITL